jgi:hypothetical protein
MLLRINLATVCSSLTPVSAKDESQRQTASWPSQMSPGPLAFSFTPANDLAFCIALVWV